MKPGIRVETRRRDVSAQGLGEVAETVILRHGQEIATLAPSDPLRYALKLPLDELRSLRRALGPVLERRPHVRRVLEAIIEYKERGTYRHRARRGREGRQGNG